MTEAEWLTCEDPGLMLIRGPFRSSMRKIRLFVVACCRRVWHLLEAESLRQAVTVFERFAEGEIDEEAFRAVARTSHPLVNYREEILSGQLREKIMYASYAVNSATHCLPGSGYRRALGLFACAGGHRAEEERAHADILREVFGNPFQLAVVRPVRLCSSEKVIINMATAIYEERSMPGGTLDQRRLAILSDALEESGCTDTALLSHLRGPDAHVRGCWALDLILGRE